MDTSFQAHSDLFVVWIDNETLIDVISDVIDDITNFSVLG